MFVVNKIGRDRGRVSQLCSTSVSTLSLLAVAVLTFSPCAAETAAQPNQGASELPPIDVRAPRPPQRPSTRPARPARQPQRSVQSPGPTVGSEPPQTTGPGEAATPLNTNTVATSASGLGLTAREIPATVEVIDQQTIKGLGLRTTTEAAEGAVGVTAGDAPGAPANFSMRGFSGTQINTLYNGIKIGPSEMTSRIMDTGNLDRIEILKGPASLLSGEGATAGAVNYVTKAPHTGPIMNEAFTAWDSFNGYRAGFGSGGSTGVKGLDYRFDLTRSKLNGFIDDAYTKLWNVSGQLNYRVNDNLKVWGAFEHKEDTDRFYWGTPLVPANFPGVVPTKGIVSGRWTQYYPGPGDFDGHIGMLNPVTIDARKAIQKLRSDNGRTSVQKFDFVGRPGAARCTAAQRRNGQSELIAGMERFARPTVTNKSARARTFKTPSRGATTRVFHLEEEKRVRTGKLKLLQDTNQLNGIFLIEHRKGMVRQRRNADEQHAAHQKCT
jgi:outer membrane receptor protein involved in Fe transport